MPEGVPCAGPVGLGVHIAVRARVELLDAAAALDDFRLGRVIHGRGEKLVVFLSEEGNDHVNGGRSRSRSLKDHKRLRREGPQGLVVPLPRH